MKLYYAPFACSLAAHIACREAGLDVELVRVDLPTKRTERGGDLFAENAMGQVPTLELDEGRILTENVAVLSYLGDRMPKGADDAAAADDAYERVRWLSFVSTEIHKKVLWPIFTPGTPDAVNAWAREQAARALRVLEGRFAERETLVGAAFTVADAYLYWALMLMPHAGIGIDAYSALRRFQSLHAKRGAVREAIAFEKERYQVTFAMT